MALRPPSHSLSIVREEVEPDSPLLIDHRYSLISLELSLVSMLQDCHYPCVQLLRQLKVLKVYPVIYSSLLLCLLIAL